MCIGAGAVPVPLGRRGRQARRGLLLPLVGPQSLPPCFVFGLQSAWGRMLSRPCAKGMPSISSTAAGAPSLSLIALPAVHALSKGTRALCVDINEVGGDGMSAQPLASALPL